MRRFLPTFLIIILVLAIYPFLGKDEKPVGVAGLPWQIQLLPDGSTKVFGLMPGQTTLGQAVARLGEDMELAVMAAPGEIGSLEMYYSHHRTGLLSAKLVLGAAVDVESLTAMRDNSPSTQVLKSGVRKYILNQEDHEIAFKAVIQSIAYIPSTDLAHETILNRFGEPAEVIKMEGQATTHYLYPTKGLDVILNEEGKEVLQYVAPSDFGRLRDPLNRQTVQ
jgi:hypothetical protein